ncbi:MAG: ankyrin repeat domain-containing protein [Paracoccaceae bacterium]
MTSLDQVRRDAKSLGTLYKAADPRARQRVKSHIARPEAEPLKHADFLHVIARERGFASWPRLVFAVETHGLDRAAKRQRLTVALFQGHAWRVEALLDATPGLAESDLHLACALYDLRTVSQLLADNPGRVHERASDRSPLLWLANSRWCHARPDLTADMLAIADLLLSHAADVDDGVPMGEGHKLSALYLAIGASDNMALGEWLLRNGADPNDNESLYHATELGHHEGLKLLLAHGAKPDGTNALLRAMDFDDVEAVRLLLNAGADPNAFNAGPVGGELPWVWPAMHQAARRMCSREMVELLLEAGGDPQRTYEDMTAYALARVYGNADVATAIQARGLDTALSPVELALANIADGMDPGRCLQQEDLPPAVSELVRSILHLPGKLPHVERLVSAGLPCDRPDPEGLTPLHVAGWEGLPDMMAFFLSQGADLEHVNGYGGTLLSTILHGSENNPAREGRDYPACLALALDAGVDLPKQALEAAGVPEVAAFLADWAETHPEQVVEHGVV